MPVFGRPRWPQDVINPGYGETNGTHEGRKRRRILYSWYVHSCDAAAYCSWTKTGDAWVGVNVLHCQRHVCGNSYIMHILPICLGPRCQLSWTVFISSSQKRLLLHSKHTDISFARSRSSHIHWNLWWEITLIVTRMWSFKRGGLLSEVYLVISYRTTVVEGRFPPDRILRLKWIWKCIPPPNNAQISKCWLVETSFILNNALSSLALTV